MKNLKRLRKEKNISQDEIAGFLGIGQSTYSSYENKTREMSYQNLIKLADFFKCSIDYLLNRDSITTLDLVEISLEKRELIEITNQLNDLETGFVKGYAKRILDEREGREREERLKHNSKF